jgi:hypothetical protein
MEDDQEVFWRDPRSLRSLVSCLKVEERHHLIDTLLFWLFEVFRAAVAVEDLTTFLSVLSRNLDLEFEETAKMITNGLEHSNLPFASEQVISVHFLTVTTFREFD